jgi:ferredoxin
MRVIVDRTICQNHGQCAIAAPEIFGMDENSEMVFEASPDPSLRQLVEDAIDACPTQAISVED